MRPQEVIAYVGSEAEKAGKVFQEKDAGRHSTHQEVKRRKEELATARDRVDAARRKLTKAQQRREEADAKVSRAKGRLASADAERSEAEKKWALTNTLLRMLVEKDRQQVFQLEEKNDEGGVASRNAAVLNWREELKVGDVLDARWTKHHSR